MYLYKKLSTLYHFSLNYIYDLTDQAAEDGEGDKTVIVLLILPNNYFSKNYCHINIIY
jgi:hypothetical protein